MLYFDNSATSLRKPPEVLEAMAYGLSHFGNAGRSHCQPAMESLRSIYRARQAVATLTGLDNPLHVAFTSGATESLNLLLHSLISPSDHVITTVLEHNSVLRPLYAIGCDLSILGCTPEGQLDLKQLGSLLKPNTKYLVCTHGSNLTGQISPVAELKAFCQRHGLIFILDTAQTMGAIPVTADMADVICFTGHKGLFGPQGTGGIVCQSQLPFRLGKTGGTGSDSFSHHQPLEMPDVFEAGTANTHGLAGLQAGVSSVNRLGIDHIQQIEAALRQQFLEGIAGLEPVTLYGTSAQQKGLPVISLNIGDWTADEVVERLWDRWEIATRGGSHCAPLAHQHYGTKNRGMVRFSFNIYNTAQEIHTAIEAIHSLAQEV